MAEVFQTILDGLNKRGKEPTSWVLVKLVSKTTRAELQEQARLRSDPELGRILDSVVQKLRANSVHRTLMAGTFYEIGEVCLDAGGEALDVRGVMDVLGQGSKSQRTRCINVLRQWAPRILQVDVDISQFFCAESLKRSAEPGTPEAVREEAFQMALRGEYVSTRTIEELRNKHLSDEPEPEVRLTALQAFENTNQEAATATQPIPLRSWAFNDGPVKLVVKQDKRSELLSGAVIIDVLESAIDHARREFDL